MFLIFIFNQKNMLKRLKIEFSSDLAKTGSSSLRSHIEYTQNTRNIWQGDGGYQYRKTFREAQRGE